VLTNGSWYANNYLQKYCILICAQAKSPVRVEVAIQNMASKADIGTTSLSCYDIHTRRPI
jgi:hypothetical protein